MDEHFTLGKKILDACVFFFNKSQERAAEERAFNRSLGLNTGIAGFKPEVVRACWGPTPRLERQREKEKSSNKDFPLKQSRADSTYTRSLPLFREGQSYVVF